jgi:hypothetical protein
MTSSRHVHLNDGSHFPKTSTNGLGNISTHSGSAQPIFYQAQ